MIKCITDLSIKMSKRRRNDRVGYVSMVWCRLSELDQIPGRLTMPDVEHNLI